MAVNILLADDHRMVREGIRCLLENVSEFNVVGEAADGYECISLVNKTKPNIVLLNVNWLVKCLLNLLVQMKNLTELLKNRK